MSEKGKIYATCCISESEYQRICAEHKAANEHCISENIKGVFTNRHRTSEGKWETCWVFPDGWFKNGQSD
jgi:hypothetical protein